MFNHVSSGVHFSGASPYFSGKIDPAFLQKWPVPVRLCFRLRHSAIRMIRLYASTSIRVLFDNFAPDRGTEYLMSMSVLSVCPAVCVCVFICRRSYLLNYTSDLHQFFMHVTYGRGSVLLWRRSDTLCTPGFMDDVIFAHKSRLLDVVAQLKRSAHAALGLAINCAQ